MTSRYELDYQHKLDDLFEPPPCPFAVGDMVQFIGTNPREYISLRPGDVREVLETHHNSSRWLLKLRNGLSPVGTSNYPAVRFRLFRRRRLTDVQQLKTKIMRDMVDSLAKESIMLHIAVKMQNGEHIGLAKEAMERDGFAVQPGMIGRPILVACHISDLKAQIERNSQDGFYWLIFSANTIGEPVAKVTYRPV